MATNNATLAGNPISAGLQPGVGYATSTGTTGIQSGTNAGQNKTATYTPLTTNGIFGDQALRLLRETWPSATMLAEELYAIFQTNLQMPTGPIQASPGQNPNPVTINYPGVGGQGITFKGPNGQPAGNIGLPNDGTPQVPPLTINAPNGLTIETPSINYVNPSGGSVPGAGGGAGTSCCPGLVKSGGPGQGPYTVDVYEVGLGGAPTEMQVLQLQIDPSETIPPNTWVLVSICGGNNPYMQVPVWLEGN